MTWSVAKNTPEDIKITGKETGSGGRRQQSCSTNCSHVLIGSCVCPHFDTINPGCITCFDTQQCQKDQRCPFIHKPRLNDQRLLSFAVHRQPTKPNVCIASFSSGHFSSFVGIRRLLLAVSSTSDAQRWLLWVLECRSLIWDGHLSQYKSLNNLF